MTSKIDTNLLAVGQNSSDHTTATLQAGSNPKNQTKPANNNKNDSGNNSIGFCHGLYTSIIRRPSLFSRFEVPHDMAKQHTCSSYILKLLLFIVNVFISPFMLVLKSITAYIYPCITGSFTQLWYYIAKKFDIFSIVMFVDPEFMPVADSLGNTQVGAAAMCTWVRVPKLIGNAQPVGKNKTVPKMVLFSKNIAPNDVKQGGLGNCWLLAALSALAEQPHYIRQMFVTNQINPRGRYKIKMYCPVDKKTMIISIDDLIPCYTSVANHTVFSHPQGNEAWVLLIEKAFAKYAGSYHNLEGGLMIYALTAFTGCNGSHFSKNWDSWGNSGLWTRSELHVIRDPKVEGMPRRRDMISFNSTQDGTTDDDAMFEMVFRLLKHRCIVAAGSVGRDTTITDGRGKEGGIVGGHAYSILKAFKPHLTTQNLRLVQLRNPWGTFEW